MFNNTTYPTRSHGKTVVKNLLDKMTVQDVANEFSLIIHKQSKLTKSQRLEVTRRAYVIIEKGYIKMVKQDEQD